MVVGANLLRIVDIVFLILSVFFGVQAIIMWRRTHMADVLKLIGDKPQYKMRLLYSIVFVGSVMGALSIAQVLKYVMNIDKTMANGPLITLLYISLTVLIYIWYSLLKEVP